MRRFGVLGIISLPLAILASDALAQRGGGAVRGGMRGAVAGGMVGGSEGASTGAKIGVVTGATRGAIDRETQARGQYEATSEYQNAQLSNFNETQPEILGTSAVGTAKPASGEAVILKDGKPIVGITFPSDWNQRTSDNCISAVSADGHAYSMLVSAEGIADKQAGIKKAKEGLGNYLSDVTFDETRETKGGALVTTGTGKGKKTGADVVFAVGVFDAGKGQMVAAAFVADSKIENYYKETIRGICQTIRRAEDFGK